ncbi:MAG: zinc ABC transporter substrate-binding protein [Flavobacteriales bacterium]|nr:zinc ABC transporter substrate-binding protein [Flavobacteriales bacterium]
MKKLFIFLSIILSLAACRIEKKSRSEDIKTIVCTTGMLGDAVKNIVGDQINVITLMGPGVDPHLYKATQGDLKSLSSADVIIYNGLHLEGKMGEIFEKLERQKHIIVAADGIKESDLINNTDFQGAHDPHLWFDVKLWSQVVSHIGSTLGQLSDSSKSEILSNTQKYVEQLTDFDHSVRQELMQLDSSKRVLITAHDAFGYFGKAYEFQVKGLQGISTTSEYGLKDISDLVNFIVDRKIKAVFVESSVSEKSLQAVVEGCTAKGHPVKIGGQLFSDAMGEENSPEGNYIGMVKHNVKIITQGLQ